MAPHSLSYDGVTPLKVIPCDLIFQPLWSHTHRTLSRLRSCSLIENQLVFVLIFHASDLSFISFWSLPWFPKKDLIFPFHSDCLHFYHSINSKLLKGKHNHNIKIFPSLSPVPRTTKQTVGLECYRTKNDKVDLFNVILKNSPCMMLLGNREAMMPLQGKQ